MMGHKQTESDDWEATRKKHLRRFERLPDWAKRELLE